KRIIFLLIWVPIQVIAQNTFPSSGNVGIGTTSPSLSLEVNGSISLPSHSGNKQIYTWHPTDGNWRIGMSASPGFLRSMATSHVEYLTYAEGSGQGFAVGVNGGASSFEITGSNHNAFFRGTVGIGATGPNHRLDVAGIIGVYGKGVINTGNSLDGSDIYINSRVIRNESQIQTDGMYINYASNGAAGAHLRLFANGTTERLRVDAGTGNVGIGTTTPNGRLNIYDSGNGTTFHIGNPNSGSGGFTTLSMGTSSDSNGYSWLQAVKSSGSTYGDYVLNASGGNVGIGTTSPDSKLSVNGNIHAKEVKVDLTGWPDYVFAKDYNLQPLEEVKHFIEQNQHLPEMPSAKEVETNGVMLGEMNKLLLKKVEELTL
ncbi:MAG: hypothetical protein RIF39_15650, partial [Cyclobacteriaceae bacterium]